MKYKILIEEGGWRDVLLLKAELDASTVDKIIEHIYSALLEAQEISNSTSYTEVL